MKNERKAALLAIRESIEMELFSSEECCVVTPTQEWKEEDYSFHRRHLEHPLVPDSEEEPELQFQTQSRRQVKPKSEPPAKDEAKHCPMVPGFMEEIEIEMEVFPPLRVFKVKSDDPSIMNPTSPDKVSHLRWRRPTSQRTGLVVRDVICLPTGHLEQLERHTVPQGKEQAALAAMGMTARITIDCGWTANQVQSRLALLFWGRFVKRAGQRFSFTYLQCLHGSTVLYVPDTPAGGWTGEQVVRISGHGALYILSHQDYPQAESARSTSKTPEVNRKEFCPEARTESCTDKDDQLGGQLHE
ncbi:uncharacterized protein LOC115590876 isoform X2 [Sparus aurata]|uniref:uncharacterized protein LOC115590876 isoform X2 n=1 Tax=Sparus aurata TaxID=8175 RepID=UPI0011C154A5|nr:uncharacterized protein LOC115590876 isoform X2 [Sparus aurata]